MFDTIGGGMDGLQSQGDIEFSQGIYIILYVLEVVTQFIYIYYIYYICIKLLYKMGHYFLERWYSYIYIHIFNVEFHKKKKVYIYSLFKM